MPKPLDPQYTIVFRTLSLADVSDDICVGVNNDTLICRIEEWVFIFDTEGGVLSAVTSDGEVEYNIAVDTISEAQELAFTLLQKNDISGWTVVRVPPLRGQA